MVTTYWTRWQDGSQDAREGFLEFGAGAIVFRPNGFTNVVEVRYDDLVAVHRTASVVELERRSGGPIRIECVAAPVLAPALEHAVELADRVRSLHEEHTQIAEELAQLRKAIDAHRLAELAARLRAHADAEERELFPALALRLGSGPLLEAMRLDHRAIENELRSFPRGDDELQLRELDRLDALVTAHMAKEEEILFPLVAAA